MSPASLIAPFATLAILGVAGLGLAGLIASRAPREAQAALAPLIAAAVIFVTSPILLLGVPPLPLAATVLGLLALVTAMRHRHSAAIARRAAGPAVLACVALALYAGPALKHRTWAAATTGNQDAYVWVSQANSLAHGPPKGAARTTPDRVPYDLIAHRSWPTAIPGGVAELAAATRLDPVHAYGLFSVVIAGLLALAVFFGARGCLQWTQRRSALAMAVVSGNGVIMLSSFYGWQAQLLLTTAATLFVLMLPDCFDRRSGPAECLGPSLFAASAIAVYGWTFAPFVVVAGAVCWNCWRQWQAASSGSGRWFARRLSTVVGLTVAIGSVAITRALITLAHGSQHLTQSLQNFWNQYAWAFPSDALGLVPRSPRDTPGIGWEMLAGVVAAVLIVRGLRFARSSPRGTVLVAASVTLIVELVVLVVTGSSPYPSFKLMAYSAPLFTLLVLSARASRPADLRPTLTTRMSVIGIAIVNVLAACFFLASTSVAVFTGFRTRPATRMFPTARAAEALPPRTVIQINVEDGWEQAWLAYYLRNRPIALQSPSLVFVGYSKNDAAHAEKFDVPADVVIRERSSGPSIWSDGRFGIYAIKNHPGK
jgi:hypothetical protein